MKVLVTNDDGITSNNLKILVEYLTKYYNDLLVLAPTTEQSAVSHKINISTPIKLIKHKDIIKGIPTYSIDSTPADCVKFAKLTLNYDFDLVISGVNNGLNLGEDIQYSGTIAAAIEGALLGKKGLALSCERSSIQGFIDSFDLFMKEYQTKDIYKEGNCFNVNLPIKPKGIKFADQGNNNYLYWFEKLENNNYLPKALKQFTTTPNNFKTDLDCYHNGYISVTPLQMTKTNYELLKSIKKENN